MCLINEVYNEVYMVNLKLSTVLCIGVCLLFIYCSNFFNTAGDTSESGNTVILGTVKLPSGGPASNTTVTLYPATYNPLKHNASVYHVDTTDINGNYLFTKIDSGYYTIHPVHSAKRTTAYISGIHARNDTVVLPACTLTESGSIKVTLPDNSDPGNGYIYIPGLPVFSVLDNTDFAVIDSVPAGKIPGVYYAEKSSSIQGAIRFDVPVVSGGTTVIWQPHWLYARYFRLNTTASGADVSGQVYDFPVLVRLDAADFDFGEAKIDGGDVRFLKPDNTPLHFEIERWDAIHQKAAIWVRVDTIFGNDSSHFIIMYWGNANATGISSSAAVFDTARGFTGVWHMNTMPLSSQGDSTGVLKDATANTINGSARGAMTNSAVVEGQNGLCTNFDGNNDFFNLGNSAALNIVTSITLEAWIRPTQYPDSSSVDTFNSNDGIIIGKYDAYTLEFQRDGNLETVDFFKNLGANKKLSSMTLNIGLNTWHYAAVSYDGNMLKIFYNGQIINSFAISDQLNISVENALIGYIEKYPGRDRFFTGDIDEVRISHIARSEDWIKLCMMNQQKDNVLIHAMQNSGNSQRK